MSGRRHTRISQKVFHPGFGAFDLGAIGSRTKDGRTAGSQFVGQSVNQWNFRSDHEQIGGDFVWGAISRAINPGIARGDNHPSVSGKDGGKGVLASAGPNDAHGWFCVHTIQPACIRPIIVLGVRPLR